MKKGVIAILSAVSGAVLGGVGTGKIWNNKFKNKSQMSDKHLALFLMMNQWVQAKQENKSIASYFEKDGYRKIAIYGMNYVGETLLKELTGSNISVEYGIDKNADAIYMDTEVLRPEDELPVVDAVIITAITFYDEIANLLAEKLDCPVLSLEDILNEI